MDMKGPIIFGLVLICIFAILLLTSTGKGNNGQAYKAVKDAQGADALDASFGTLAVSSNPSIADIFLNDVYKGTTPKEFAIEEGTYALKLTRAGYTPFTKSISIAKGETSTVAGILAPVASDTPSPSPTASINNTNGTLTVMTTPIDANLDIYPPGVLANPVYRGLTPVSIGLLATTYTIVITKAGYDNYYTTASVIKGRVTTVNAVLVKSGR